MRNADLGDFLRASRARLRPGPSEAAEARQPGLDRRRRVPGLRREEVARRAGVSVDYYARLEQGRTKLVSRAVLHAIASALELNETEQEYFFTLVADQTAPQRQATPAPPSVEHVRPGVRQMLDSLTQSAALVHGLGMQILAMNPLARALFTEVAAAPVRERNFVRWVFLGESAKELLPDWPDIAAETVAVLRVDSSLHPDDRALHELVGELAVRSAEFRALWYEHRVYECHYDRARFRHPVAGSLELDYESLDVAGSDRQRLVAYTAPVGSPSEESLRLLASWSASSRSSEPAPRDSRTDAP